MDKSNELTNYLDPHVLARIENMELRARMIAEGFFTGMHHSPHRGMSVEFADHRQYSQGDDIRHIDWKLFAKTNKYYIKEYEQETNLEIMLIIDASESMNFKSEQSPLSKYDYASTCAAATSMLALRQHDAVGLTLFDESILEFLKPSNNPHQWKIISKELSQGAGRQKTSIGKIISEIADRLTHRTLIFLISDLLEDASSLLNGLKLLRYRNHEIVVWQILDHAELHFDFDKPTKFKGLEDSGYMYAQPDAIRENYNKELKAHQNKIRQGCASMKIDYSIFNTSESVGFVLSDYFSVRSLRIRQRSSRTRMRG